MSRDIKLLKCIIGAIIPSFIIVCIIGNCVSKDVKMESKVKWSTVTTAGYILPDKPEVVHYNKDWVVILSGDKPIALVFNHEDAQRIIERINTDTK